jgi:antitoxin (DNA-binding transcriptional repressor) of toxin-antitoxin stability system
MRKASVSDVKAKFSGYIKSSKSGPIVITRNGNAVAVLLAPTNDDDLERLLLAHSPRFQGLLNRSRKSIEAGKGLSHTEFWKAVKQQPSKRKS